ncbi:MAG: glycosyltransferase family 4 protein [Patescibacteria group bacterium]
MKKMTVAVICADLNPDDLGGAEVHIVEVIKGLAERGHTLHVFVGNDLRAASLFSEFENVQLHAVPYKKVRNLNSLFFTLAAVKAIKKSGLKFNLLHAKQTFPQGIAGALLKKKLRIPLYITVQNPLAYRQELVLTGPLKILFAPFIEALGFAVRWALRKSDLAACVSQFSQQHAKRMGAKNTTLIPNGIRLEKFKLHAGERKEFEIVSTSTLIPRNGMDTLIESLPEVVKKHQQTHVKIAGEGPMKDELVNRIKTLNLEKHVTFLGTLKHDKIPEFVKNAHLFVRPSRHEGFGVSFIEAMALGTPVITCPVGGIPDFITDGETGFLVPASDPHALANAIHFVFEHPDAVKEVTANARQLVENRYDWQKIVDAVEAAYSRLV